MTLPDTCHIEFSKKTKIEKFNDKYLLVSHPTPQLEGEMLILQYRKEDQP